MNSFDRDLALVRPAAKQRFEILAEHLIDRYSLG
jgi:hypothetical protein